MQPAAAMRTAASRWIVPAALLGALYQLAASSAVEGGTLARWCRRSCADEIRACIDGGESARVCRRLRSACLERGLAVCIDPGPEAPTGEVPLSESLVPPADVTAAGVSPDTIELHWRDTNARERGYVVERSVRATGAFSQVGVVAANVDRYRDGGRTPERTYFYRVRAIGRRQAVSAPSAVVSATTPATPAPPAGDGAGRVRVMKTAGASFDSYTQAPTAAAQTWMREHYARMLVWSPYFDTRLAWYPNAWFYQDLYALYPGDALTAQHPEWILRDAAGTPLYIPYACGGGTCPQYAADPGHAAFRADWIARARAHAAKGYRGIFVDDVNLRMMVSNGLGELVAPLDPRTGSPMTTADWRRYVAEFVEAVRSALPDLEIVHNQVWFSAPPSDPFVQRAIEAADVIELERGFNDRGIRGGGGTYGFDTFAAFIDFVHARGRGVALDVEATWGAEYALATYLLVSSGRDLLGPDVGVLPESWWPAYDLDLGDPAGERYAWNALLRRDFAGGMVLVNPPDQPTRTVSLGGSYRTLDGALRTSVTLAATDGIVLLVP